MMNDRGARCSHTVGAVASGEVEDGAGARSVDAIASGQIGIGPVPEDPLDARLRGAGWAITDATLRAVLSDHTAVDGSRCCSACRRLGPIAAGSPCRSYLVAHAALGRRLGWTIGDDPVKWAPRRQPADLIGVAGAVQSFPRAAAVSRSETVSTDAGGTRQPNPATR